jgi:hypothetical protein
MNEQLGAGRVAVQEPVPSVTVTLPVGVPTAGEAATTVKLTVTDWPGPEGEGESPVIVVTVFPRMVRPAVPPLVACAADPEYETEIVRAPTAVPETEAVQLETPAAPGTRVHAAAGVHESPAVEEESVTVPAGLDFAPAASTSLTVTVTGAG